MIARLDHVQVAAPAGGEDAARAFYGGLLGALPVAWWYVRRHSLDGWRTADVMAPGVAIGQAIGRVGETGNAQGTTPHLHFERMPGGGPAVDPLPLLVRACRYH